MEKENRGSIYTKNMFIESHNELNLSLFEKKLTAEMVNDAFNRALKQHMDNIRNGIADDFNIDDKKEARDYLLGKLN